MTVKNNCEWNTGLSLWRTKNANWHVFPNPLLCRGAVEFFGFWFFYDPSHIAYYAVKIYIKKPIQSEWGDTWRGWGVHRSSSLSYHASETLNQCRVKWFDKHGWWSESLFLYSRFHCCKSNNVYRLNHVTCNQSWIKLKF